MMVDDVDVMRFGAVGDGETHDSAALLAASQFASGTFVPGRGLLPIRELAQGRALRTRFGLFLTRDVLERQYQERHGGSINARDEE